MPGGALDDLGDEHVEAHVLGVRARLLAAGEVDEVVHQQRQLLDLLDHVVEQAVVFLGVHELTLLLQDLDVGAQAGDRCAQLVGGVGDELSLGVDGGVERAHRVLEGVEHRVEADRQASQLVLPLAPDGLDASAQVLGDGDVLGGSGEALERQHGRPRHETAEQGGERDAADDDEEQDQAQAGEQAVDFGERLGELHGVPLAERLGEHAQVDAVDVGIAQERLPAFRGQGTRAGFDGERHGTCGPGAFDDVAAGVDHLLVAQHLIRRERESAEEVADGRAGRPRLSDAVHRWWRSRRGRAEVAFGGEPQPFSTPVGLAALALGVEPAQQQRALEAAVAKLGVDLLVQLVGGEHVGEDRGEHHRDRHGGGGGDGDASPEAHEGARST